eukprot:11749408-Ditylum_brightwellii.AAC.2
MVALVETDPTINEAERANHLHCPQPKSFILCLSWPHPTQWFSHQLPPLPSFTPLNLLIQFLHAQGLH